MKRICSYFLFLLLPTIISAQKVILMKLDGTINPVSADYIHDGIQKATDEKAQCLIIELNTPGGLLKSTRNIVSDMLESKVPVVVYVAPAGSQSGSAGVFITLAANIAAMAPGTNIGAAHPVELQGPMDSTMSTKVTNDAAAFIRTIAQKRSRNLEWAENAVRYSVSLTENEAQEQKVIDLVANDEQDLLEKIDGKTVAVASGNVTLHTKGAVTEEYKMGTIEKILNILSDPNIAYILMLLGLYGVLFELYNPGAILPGIVGVIALILAFYSMHALPINYAGLALIIFAIILFLLELKLATHGILAIGGAVSLLLGSMMLIRASSSLEFVKLSRSVVITSTVVTTLFFLFVIGLGLKAQRKKPVTGIEGMIGLTGECIIPLDPLGKVRLQGELWYAESVSGSISDGKKVRVTAIKGLKLFVEEI